MSGCGAGFWCGHGHVVCRVAEGCERPLDELEVALDAMCAMGAPFYLRYEVLSAVDRRVGGQGLVQFASIPNNPDRVRLLCPSLLLSRIAHEELACGLLFPDPGRVAHSLCAAQVLIMDTMFQCAQPSASTLLHIIPERAISDATSTGVICCLSQGLLSGTTLELWWRLHHRAAGYALQGLVLQEELAPLHWCSHLCPNGVVLNHYAKRIST